jgi:hypothetical protein
MFNLRSIIYPKSISLDILYTYTRIGNGFDKFMKPIIIQKRLTTTNVDRPATAKAQKLRNLDGGLFGYITVAPTWGTSIQAMPAGGSTFVISHYSAMM